MNTFGKIVISTIIALVIVVGGYFLWQYLSVSNIIPGGSGTGNEPGEIPTNTEPVVMIDGQIFDFWVNPTTEDVFYVNQDGRISKMTPEGSDQFLSSQTIPNLSQINPTMDGSSVIIGFGYPQTPSFSVFNTSKRNFQPLPAGTTAADWKPQSNNVVVYLQNNGLSSRLSTLDLATGKSTELLKINQKDLVLDWAFPETIYLYEKPSNQIKSNFWSYGVKSRTIKKLGEEQDLLIKWWPEKNLGLKWSDGVLSLVDSGNQLVSSIELRTLPSKCFLGEPAIYCSGATRQDLALVRDLANTELKRSSRSEESIYSILSFNLNTSKLPIRNLFNGDEVKVKFHASKIEKQINRLLLLNEYDHKLYSLPL